MTASGSSIPVQGGGSRRRSRGRSGGHADRRRRLRTQGPIRPGGADAEARHAWVPASCLRVLARTRGRRLARLPRTDHVRSALRGPVGGPRVRQRPHGGRRRGRRVTGRDRRGRDEHGSRSLRRRDAGRGRQGRRHGGHRSPPRSRPRPGRCGRGAAARARPGAGADPPARRAVRAAARWRHAGREREGRRHGDHRPSPRPGSGPAADDPAPAAPRCGHAVAGRRGAAVRVHRQPRGGSPADAERRGARQGPVRRPAEAGDGPHAHRQRRVRGRRRAPPRRPGPRHHEPGGAGRAARRAGVARSPAGHRRRHAPLRP